MGSVFTTRYEHMSKGDKGLAEKMGSIFMICWLGSLGVGDEGLWRNNKWRMIAKRIDKPITFLAKKVMPKFESAVVFLLHVCFLGLRQ